jgi:hypothetical protein
MSRRQLLLGAFATGHLVLVACGAAGLLRALPRTSGPARAVQWYGAMSGADNDYGFFAPGVGAQLRAVFVLTDAEGRTWEDDFGSGPNQEVRLRLNRVVSTFPAEDGEEALRRDLLASWAGSMFGRHPEARKVEVRVEAYDVPSMAEYRGLARPQWVLVYAEMFVRDRAANARAERRAP